MSLARRKAPVGISFEQPCGDTGFNAAIFKGVISVVAPHGFRIFAGLPLYPPVSQEQIQVAIAIIVKERRGNRYLL